MCIKKITRFVVGDKEFETESEAALEAAYQKIIGEKSSPLKDNLRVSAREIIGLLQKVSDPSNA